MKINEMIKKLRIENNYTQEQIANLLGVSTPAVNKWEKGISYPDITFLPALARILNTDLNTLLSFKDDLSNIEIATFLNQISDTMKKEGFEKGYNIAIEKLKEYPTCDGLIINIAMLLDGAILMYLKDKTNEQKYKYEIDSLYNRALQSSDISIKEQAQSCVISRLIKEEKYTEAQELLNEIRDKSVIDKRQLQANLYISKGEFDKAGKYIEEKLLSATNEIHSSLISLMEIAIKENRLDDAEYIANVDKQASKIFDLWEYNSYIAQFQLYSSSKQKVKCLKILIPMLKSLNKKWEINKSPLYKHIQTKNIDENFGQQMQKVIINFIKEEAENDFIKDSVELNNFIKENNIDI